MTDANEANDANELDEAIMRELKALVLCDSDEEEEPPSSYEEEPSDEIPPSLLSYLEYSRRRRAACEELIVQELEDEVEGSEEHWMPCVPTSNVSTGEEEQRRRGGKDFEEKLRGIKEAQRMLLNNLKRQMEEEAMEEEQRRRQEEEENKRKQEEELRKREKIRTETEKQKLADEGKRIREEEERERMEEMMRGRCEEEEQRKAVEEKRRRKKEEERRREERSRLEMEKRRLEDEIRRMEEEEMREAARKEREEEEKRQQREEEQRKMMEEQERLEDEMRRVREEEERKKMYEKLRCEEEAQRRAMEEKRRRKKEEERKKEEKMELEKKKLEDEVRRTKEEEEKKKREEEERKKEERIKVRMEKQKEDEMRRMEEEEKKRKKALEEEERIQREQEERKQVMEEARRKSEEEERRKLKEAERKKAEEERRREEEERKKLEEDERRKADEERRRRDEVEKRRREEEERKREEKTRMELEKRKLEDERRRTREQEKKIEHEKRGMTEEDDGRQTKEANMKREETAPIGEEPEKLEKRQKEEGGGKRETRPLPLRLPDHTESKRLTWMRQCVSWTELCARRRRRPPGSGRRRRRTARARGLPPLCPDELLRAAGTRTLQEASVVTLQDLSACSLSTLTQCSQLRSITLRRCGLKALEGVAQLPELRLIDVQENNISFVDCENMTSLRVLRLGHNKLTSIHGLSGAENLDVLDLSHNSITRIAGLQSARKLQTLSLAHNQLISTKGLRDVYTLLHLDCSHNHLASVEGLEDCALLQTLDLTANSLTEPPPLQGQVLLRELRLDDNSISCLRGLAACWLPLLRVLTAAENRITQLPPMSDAVSLASLDLRFNCLSELKNVCDGLEGCDFLTDVHLAGNPLLRESGWRSALQKSVSSLRTIDGKGTSAPPSSPPFSPPDVSAPDTFAVQDNFLAFCQAQLQQTRDLQQRHSEELSTALLPLDAVTISCRHSAETLRLAVEQRYAHEYGDTTLNDHEGESMEEFDFGAAEVRRGPEDAPPPSPDLSCGESVQHSSRTLEKFPAEAQPDAPDPPTAQTQMSDGCGDDSCSFRFLSPQRQTARLGKLPATTGEDLNTTAAVVIQQQWRKYRQKCGNTGGPVTAEGGGGDGGRPEFGPSHSRRRSAAAKDHAATLIQACWRGFTLRRRLASALAAVTRADTGEDDTLEEGDLDALVFDEAGLKGDWTSALSVDSPPPGSSASEESPPTSHKPPQLEPESYQYVLPPPLVWAPKHAWGAGEHAEPAGRGAPSEISNRDEAPRSQLVCGLSEESERILGEWGFTNSSTAILMLKRAQKMKNQHQKKAPPDPSVHLAPFRSCSYQLASVEPLTRPAPRKCSSMRVAAHPPAANVQLTDAQMKQERVLEWLQSQSALSDRHSGSEHFLPEISPDLLNGGRVQLVAKPGYTEHLHQDSGRLAKSSLTTQPCREISHPRNGSVGRARKAVSPPERVPSGPSKKERMSFRDNQVQLSGGWGCGKKRGRVRK